MKKTNLLLSVPALLLAGVLVTLNYGCGKKPAAPEKAGPAQKGAPVTSAVKTSFNEVTAQLDSGGDFYLYLGTAQWLDGLSAKIGNWREKVAAMPGLKPEDATNVNRAFAIVTRLVKDSGLEDISGLGLSSVEIEKGLYRNKALLHHYPGKDAGFLWQLGGKEPHALTGLDLLPADTVLAAFSDANLPLLWNAVKKEVAQTDLPQAQAWLEQFPAVFEQKTQVNWDAFLKSLGGEFGFVLTLDPSNNIPIPLPGAALEIPAPGLLVAVKVNDDTIFNRIDEALKANPLATATNLPGLRMRTMVVPLPLPVALRPSAASGGGYLFIATSDELIEHALAVKSGRKAGLKSTGEFKRLAQGLPDQGNQFAFLSQRFALVLVQVQQQVIAANSKTEPQMAQWLRSILGNGPAFAYSVGVNTPDGCLTIGNGNQSYASSALLPGVAAAGLLSAIAVPNFVKARTTSQKNACINNLRMLDAAKQQWALEKGKQSTDVPTMEDIKPYLPNIPNFPFCPKGGTYTLNAAGQSPACSIPEHELP